MSDSAFEDRPPPQRVTRRTALRWGGQAMLGAVAGGKVIVGELRDRQEVAELPERVVINCTGFGAAELFGDEQLMPIKGQLTILFPQPEVDYIAIQRGLYMFPRSDGILLGGTFERGDAHPGRR